MKRIIIGTTAVAAALAFALGVSAQTTEPVSFTLSNDTAQTLVALHISHSGTDQWEEDILGVDMVDAGESVDVTIDDDLTACEYDVRADFSDGDTLDVRGVNFCELDGETLSISE